MDNKIKTFKNLQYLENLNGSDTAVVLFHGYGASMRDLYGISDYLSADADWFFPDGPISVPLGFMMEGRAWFPIDMRELEAAMASGEFRRFEDKSSAEFDRSQEMVLEFLASLRQKYKKLVIGGFSQGAMLASHVFAQAKADGLALFSGTLIDKAKLEPKLSDVSGMEFLQSHGSADALLEFGQARNLFSLLEDKGMKGEFIPFEGGHEIPEKVLVKFAQYLIKNS